MHSQVSLYLGHGVEIHTNHNQQRRAAHEKGYFQGEVEQSLYDCRYDSNECKEERPRQNDSREDPIEILFHFL